MLYSKIVTYIGLFNQNIDNKEIRIFLESSPRYPNLLSVLETLHRVGLDAQVGQCDWEYLSNLNSPILLHIKSGNNQDLVIAKWDYKQNSLRILNLENKRWEIKKRDDITKYWDGVVIYTTDKQIDYHYTTTVGTTVIICLVLLVLFKTNILNIDVLFYSPLLLGSAVSYCLYLKSRMANGGIIDKLCHISKASDCNRVEESKYSTVLGFKMDCLAFAFFIAQIFCVSVSHLFIMSDILYQLYFISTVISLPTIVYSIYGQLKVRKICPLCVIVALCITIEALIFVSLNKQDLHISIIALYFYVFFISIAVLHYISKIIKQEKYLLTDSINLLKLKRKEEILFIESTLVKPVHTPFVLGNETSPTKITTILSPSCKHCKMLVAELISLQNNGVRFNWQIILGQTTKTDFDIIADWIRRFLCDKDAFFKDLTSWCNGTDQLSTQKSFYKDVEVNSIIQSFNENISKLRILGFPRIIINNRLLSSIYTSKDLKYLIIDQSNKI